MAANSDNVERGDASAGHRIPLFNTEPSHPLIHVSDEVKTALLDFARRPAHAVGLRMENRPVQMQAMRRLIGSQMDLDKAKQRKSQRFTRTYFTQDVTTDRPMHLGKETATVARPIEDPMRVVYHEGTDVFALTKVKPLGSTGGEGLATDSALSMTKAFFLEQGLISENGVDRVGPSEVRERHIDAPAANGDSSDFLAQQDVRLNRTYEGKPVINSQATLGVLPGANEIVSVQLSNWLPADAATNTQVKPAYGEAMATAFAETLEGNMAARVQNDTANEPSTIHINHVTEAWFQDQHDGLVPVLVFEGTSGNPDKDGQTQPVVVAMNPLGDSSAIDNQGRVPRATQPPAPLAEASTNKTSKE